MKASLSSLVPKCVWAPVERLSGLAPRVRLGAGLVPISVESHSNLGKPAPDFVGTQGAEAAAVGDLGKPGLWWLPSRS
jgi:hypothetical protein